MFYPPVKARYHGDIMRTSAYITACAGALIALLAAPSQLWAQGKKYRVSIDTDPSGASVWIDDRAGDPAGTTPYDTRLTTGKHTIFLELDGYAVSVREITVKKRKRGQQTFNFELEEQSMGSIDVLAADDSDHTDGARVFLDGREVGTVPDSFDAAAGSHQVEVVKDGYKRYESRVKVTAGESVELTVALDKLGGGTSKGKGKGKGKKGKKDKKGKSDEPTSPILRADVGLGSGTRLFDYFNAGASAAPLGTANLLPYSAPSLALANMSLELYLGGFSSALSRFSIFGGASMSLGGNSVTQDNINIATTWLRREVGVRVHLGSFGIDLAEAGSAFTFDPNDLMAVGNIAEGIPDASYESVRLGLWYAGGNEKMSFGVGASGLYVLSRTGVAERFDNTDPSVFGVGGNAWFRMQLFAGIEGAISGAATYFVYSMTPEENRDTTGGYDLMLDLVGSVGYRF